MADSVRGKGERGKVKGQSETILLRDLWNFLSLSLSLCA